MIRADFAGFRIQGSTRGEKVSAFSGTKQVQESTQLHGGVFMLVLTRRPGEAIIIDDVIRLTVVSVKGDRIRLGIEAPSSVVVDRQEIHARRGRVPKSAAEPCCIVEPTKKEMLKKLLTPILA